MGSRAHVKRRRLAEVSKAAQCRAAKVRKAEREAARIAAARAEREFARQVNAARTEAQIAEARALAAAAKARQAQQRAEAAQQRAADARAADERRLEGERAKRAADRARRAGATEVERVRPLDVFRRDGWQCCICGEPIDPATRGTDAPDSPTLDHATPLAAGGAHTRGNLITAHKACNVAKGTRPWHEVCEAMR